MCHEVLLEPVLKSLLKSDHVELLVLQEKLVGHVQYFFLVNSLHLNLWKNHVLFLDLDSVVLPDSESDVDPNDKLVGDLKQLWEVVIVLRVIPVHDSV